jgi:hypothetical protein
MRFGLYYNHLARFIFANTHPDHDTIASFRKRFLEQLKSLFVQILMPGLEMGLVKLAKFSLDGIKIKANTSKHQALSWDHDYPLDQLLQAEGRELLRPNRPMPKKYQNGWISRQNTAVVRIG